MTAAVGIGMCLHAIFVGVTLVGGFLFVVWAMKLKPDQMKEWVKWLLIVGVLGSLLTGAFGWRGTMGGRWMMKDGKMMMEKMEDGKMLMNGEMMGQ